MRIFCLLISASFCIASASSGNTQIFDTGPIESWSTDHEVLDLINRFGDTGTDGGAKGPSEKQRFYLQQIHGKSSNFGVTIKSSDGTIAGRDVLRALQGETDDAVAVFSIKLKPYLAGQEANDVLAKEGLLVFDASKSFGVISAGRIIGKKDTLVDPKLYEEKLRESLEDLRRNPNFDTVAPERDHVNFQARNRSIFVGTNPTQTRLFTPSHVFPADISNIKIDWGLRNIKAKRFWKNRSMLNGSVVGILDSGFALHQDLPFWDLDPQTPADNHGNHVAGILCAKHDGVGISGVLPNCFIVARSPNFFSIPGLQGSSPESMVAVLNKFEEIVFANSNLKAINVSMGYNWKDDGVTEIDDDTKKDIATMAAQLEVAFQLAYKRGIFVVSAAGNDSEKLKSKMSAVWSSPLNFAIRAYCLKNGWCNGVIVEAHDANDHSSRFSNKDGDISCPGVGVVSTVAYDEHDIPSTSSYAEMSGTSMASPFCAGGLVLLSRLLGDPSAKEVIECAKLNGRRGTHLYSPALDIEEAYNSCR